MAYDTTDFEKEVLERSRTIPVLVDFWADWCGPCRTLGPVLERLADEQVSSGDPDWVLAKVDTEAHSDVAMKYGVRGIPNVKLFVNGEVADEFTGALPEFQVRSWLKKALPGKNQERIDQAVALLAGGRADEARQILEEVLSEEPDNDHARVLMAQALLNDDPEKAEETVRGIHEDSDVFDQAEAVRTMATLARAVKDPASLPESVVKDTWLGAARNTLAGKYDEALEGFIDVIREDRYFADDISRVACIAIFRMLGPSHEITRKHRRAFDSALYV